MITQEIENKLGEILLDLNDRKDKINRETSEGEEQYLHLKALFKKVDDTYYCVMAYNERFGKLKK